VAAASRGSVRRPHRAHRCPCDQPTHRSISDHTRSLHHRRMRARRSAAASTSTARTSSTRASPPGPPPSGTPRKGALSGSRGSRRAGARARRSRDDHRPSAPRAAAHRVTDEHRQPATWTLRTHSRAAERSRDTARRERQAAACRPSSSLREPPRRSIAVNPIPLDVTLRNRIASMAAATMRGSVSGSSTPWMTTRSGTAALLIVL
jgi:hypothetical protein